MRFLIDTNCWIWGLCEPQRLGRRAAKLIENPNNEIFLSIASIWEISIKASKGKIRFKEAADTFLMRCLKDEKFTRLPIEVNHALHICKLAPLHGDPFDRLIIAQAVIEGLPVLTSDPQFAGYPIKVLNASE